MNTKEVNVTDTELSVKFNQKKLIIYTIMLIISILICQVIIYDISNEPGNFNEVIFAIYIVEAPMILLTFFHTVKMCHREEIIKIDKHGFHNIFQSPQVITWNNIKNIINDYAYQNDFSTLYIIRLEVDSIVLLKNNKIISQQFFRIFRKHTLVLYTNLLDQSQKKIYDAISHHLHAARKEAAQDRHHAISR